MVDFKGLETFVWVVALGSFRGAAQKLNTTQPAVSQRIAQLEDEFGGRLLNRESRQVTTTPQGRQLLVYAEKLLDLRSEMMSTVRDSSAVRGVFRLGTSETIVHTWLPAFVKEVNRIHPNLTLEIEVDISATLRAKLLAQEIDMAFLLGPLAAPTVRNRLLCDYPLAFIASPALDLPSPATVYDLARFPIITFQRKTQPYEIVRGLLHRPDLPAVRLHASASLATIVHMAVEGLGVAVIPHEIVEPELRRGRLRLIETELNVPALTFTASWLGAPDMRAVDILSEIAARTAAASREAPQPLGLPAEA